MDYLIQIPNILFNYPEYFEYQIKEVFVRHYKQHNLLREQFQNLEMFCQKIGFTLTIILLITMVKSKDWILGQEAVFTCQVNVFSVAKATLQL